jgi:hypothetical protein
VGRYGRRVAHSRIYFITKGKSVTQHINGGRGEHVELLLIHDLGTRWGEWPASPPVRNLPPGKGLPVSVGQKAGWAPELVVGKILWFKVEIAGIKKLVIIGFGKSTGLTIFYIL